MAKKLFIGNVRSNPHHRHSNLKPPKPPRYSFSVRLNQENQKKKKNKSRITKKEIAQLVSWKKEIAAEHKQAQDSCLLRAKNPPPPPPPPAGSISDHDDDALFLDQSSEPVRFDFGDDYCGARLFLDLRRELMYKTACDAWSRRGFCSTAAAGDDGVGSLSSETDMINLFFKDNLF